jgi:TRAP-type C4-dicarboxylate transport system substrate-binding protein
MFRRHFLKTSALIGASVVTGAPVLSGAMAQQAPRSGAAPRRIILAGYGPSTTSFSRGLNLIGDRLEARFGDEVEAKYVYNITDLGYTGGGDLRSLVDSGVLALAYVTMATGIPELELAALPFLFSDVSTARAAMDGALGQAATARIEAETNFRILGYFENGFRHVSNNVRPVYAPADLAGVTIRCLDMQVRTFEILGAKPRTMSLAAAIPLLEAGTLDGQENPFENTVSYGPYLHQRYHTATFHSYLSRPIFVHRPTFDAWPQALQSEMRAAVREAVTYQRGLHGRAEVDSRAIIREAGGEIVDLTPEQRAAFVEAVAPIYAGLNSRYSRELLDLVHL